MKAFGPLLRQAQRLPDTTHPYTQKAWAMLHSLARYVIRHRNGNRSITCQSCYKLFDVINGYFWTSSLFNEEDPLHLKNGLTRQQLSALKRAKEGIDFNDSAGGVVCGICMEKFGYADSQMCPVNSNRLLTCYGSLCTTTPRCCGTVCCDAHCYCNNCASELWHKNGWFDQRS